MIKKIKNKKVLGHTCMNLREIDAKNWQISFWSLKADLAITCDHTDQLR